jgi:hypothetical protein
MPGDSDDDSDELLSQQAASSTASRHKICRAQSDRTQRRVEQLKPPAAAPKGLNRDERHVYFPMGESAPHYLARVRASAL